jgi:chemotaxis protein MotB
MPDAEVILESVGKVLKERRYPLRIEGHTCDLPIRSTQFPSNWELSAIRAINVTKFLINRVGFEPERISVAGYGQYHPLVKNDIEENRARNRRVDIVIITGLARSNAVNVVKKPVIDGNN